MKFSHRNFGKLHYVELYSQYDSWNSSDSLDNILDSINNFLFNRNIKNSEIISFNISNENDCYVLRLVYRKE